MKQLSLLVMAVAFFGMVLFPILVNAQSHPTDSGAEYVTTFEVTVDIIPAVAQAHNEVLVWLMPDSTYDYVLDIEAIEFTGTCTGLDQVPLADIVEAGTDAAIVEGTDLGYMNCSASISEITIDIWAASCASRSGSGNTTSFSICTPVEWCTRVYEVECDGIDPGDITQGTGTYTECGSSSSSCEDAYYSTTIE